MDTSTIKVLDCGHEPGSNALGMGLYSETRNGRSLCPACADAAEAEAFKLAGDARTPYGAYLAGNPNERGSLKLTTWTGKVLAEVLSVREIPLTRVSYTHGKTILSFTARDSLGRLWYGRGNPGIATTVRRKGA